MESNPIRLPYKHLKDAELELVGFDDSRVANGMANGGTASSTPAQSPQSYPEPSQQARFGGLKMLILASTVGAGVQFGWALQLSLLTPYVQTLGISHAFSSFIWLCGPITGLVVQPCVGIWSDKCYSKYGRRRPFILIGSLMISVAVTTIGFAADIGYLLGDTKEHCSTYKGTRVGAAIVFVIGFWMLDLANNTVQGPARALLADLSGPDQKNSANAIFCSWMAVGNIFGYSAGASGNWHRWFPFLTTRACCEACANLKAAFLVAVVFLSFCTLMTLHFAKEIPLAKSEHRLSDSAPLLNDKQPIFGDSSVEMTVGDHTSAMSGNATTENSRNVALKDEGDQSEVFNDGPGAVLVNLLTSMRHLPPAMHSVLVVMALSWLSWFPFILFDTDWMGREVYHGDPNGNASQVSVYGKGVREGAFGLLLNSVVLGVSSLLIEPMCRCLGSRLVWAMSNFTVFICMTSITVISLASVGKFTEGIQDVIGDNKSIKTAALVIFSLLGFPLAITYSVPFSITAEVTADTGGGQGLAIGVLNLAIVIPQIIVSLGAGPWDALFGGGNIPAFALASLSALAAGVIAVLKLPNLSSSAYKSTGFHFG